MPDSGAATGRLVTIVTSPPAVTCVSVNGGALQFLHRTQGVNKPDFWLTMEPYNLTPSNPAAVNSICTLHAPKYIPKVIGAYIHAFLTFGFQKCHFAEFL